MADNDENASTLSPLKVENINENATRELDASLLQDVSLNVSQQEVDTFIDSANGWLSHARIVSEEKQHHESVIAGNISDGPSEDDDLENGCKQNEEMEQDDDSIKDGVPDTDTALHCALCREFFKRPKILDCLHSFCERCLDKRVKPTHKFIICPLKKCKFRTFLGLDRVGSLPDNAFIERCLSAVDEPLQVANCVVCQLHELQSPSTGQCLDCEDVMCKSCCEKHTFSRQTAKHKVISFEEMKTNNTFIARKQTIIVRCEKHASDFAEKVCKQCKIAVCKSCSLNDHQRHELEELDEAISNVKIDIQEKVKRLKEAVKCKLFDDTKEAERLIEEHERAEFETLKKAKEELIAVIDQKYEACAEQLQKEFNIKKRKHCKHKKSILDSIHYTVDAVDNTVGLMLSDEGLEIVKLESLVARRIEAIEDRINKVQKTHPKLKTDAKFPSLHMYKEHANVLRGLTFFDTNFIFTVEKQKERQKRENKLMHALNGEVRMNIGTGSSTISSSKGMQLHSQPKPLMSLDFTDHPREHSLGNSLEPQHTMLQSTRSLKGPLGRGAALRNYIGPSKLMTGSQTSLLGEYPGDKSHNFSFPLDHSSRMFQNDYHPDFSVPGSFGQQNMKEVLLLKLHSSINVKIHKDQGVPDIVDGVFVSQECFVVADTQNSRLKMFNTSGKFVNYLDDTSPMAVTFCDNHLVWNSQNSSLRVYNMHQQRIVNTLTVPPAGSHPLTTFNNNKFLVGNMPGFTVEAFTVAGHLAHTIQPVNKEGNVIGQVSSIATRSLDQLVSVECTSHRVVVNNFDGQFVGEYFDRDFEPGGVCITERSDIFVTDKSKNRLVLLNSRGQFVRDWRMLVNNPCCIACNGKGNLIVAGRGKYISLYEYSY